MASEAQRLIGISLTKIAQSRAHRSGVSLHKNLLVATVLQKARYIFMEEAYNMVHYHAPAPTQVRTSYQDELVVGLTAEEAGIESPSSDLEQCTKCSENQDKEELVYLDLDKKARSISNNNNNSSSSSSGSCLKRRCAVTDWETEEAVQSILPKRSRCSTTTTSSTAATEEGDDSVFLDEATILSDAVSKQLVETKRGGGGGGGGNQENNNNSSGSAMEIDRITSLVSIFSFGLGEGKLNRSVSTPDLCSAQAKDVGDVLLQQQRPFIAMTV